MDLTDQERRMYSFVQQLKHKEASGHAIFLINLLLGRLPAAEQQKFLLKTIRDATEALNKAQSEELALTIQESGVRIPTNSDEAKSSLQWAALSSLKSRFGMDNSAKIAIAVCDQT